MHIKNQLTDVVRLSSVGPLVLLPRAHRGLIESEENVFCILCPLVYCRHKWQDLEMSAENNEKGLRFYPSY